MQPSISRRRFIHNVTLGAAGLGAILGIGAPVGLRGFLTGAEEKPLPGPLQEKATAKPSEFALTVISGKPRERGRAYGEKFKDRIGAFLEKEIYSAFTGGPSAKDAMLRYSAACLKEVKAYSKIVHDELEGVAEGSGLDIEEVTLITLHEELWHRGVLPSIEHCTAVAAGPPATHDGSTYVGQTWDWMQSVYGLSTLLLWKRPEGPSLLSYAYPGLWAGAGLNSAGIALTWTSGSGVGIPGPRVGIPSYVLIAQMLYQDTLDAALAEAQRARHAGWFTFVLADGSGHLANVEGTPNELAMERSTGTLARVSFGTRQVTKTPDGKPVTVHPRCRHMAQLLESSKGKLDRGVLQGFLADHGTADDPATKVCVHGSTLDAMLFDTTLREAYVCRGPACSGRWQRFAFDGVGPR